MKIEKVFILNIGTGNEELKRKINQLDFPYKVEWEILPGIKGTNTDRLWNSFKTWKIKDSKNSWWNRDLKEGEIGCALSHLQAWEKAYEEGWNCVLFLEEDFNLKIDIKEVMFNELPDEVDIDGFYLGRNKIGDEEEKEIGTQWLKPLYSYNTHAYCLTRSGLEKILKYDYINNIIPSDEFLSATFTTHPRKDVAEKFKPTLNFYANKLEFISQTSNKNNSKTENTKYAIRNASNWEEWKQTYLDPIIQQGEWDLIVDHLGDEVYEFPLFTKRFCDEIIAMTEELDNWTYSRHEHYPTTDVLLQDIGMNEIYNRVLDEVIRPLAIHIWKLEGKSWNKVNSENFLARYLPDAQSHLSLHHDHSHLSLVLKLNDEFDGGGTYFPKYGLLSNPERVGTATLHPGQITHRHGARPIYSGRRYITVSFITNNGDI